MLQVLNTKELGERKNVNLPGVHVDIPVLTEKDIDDLTVYTSSVSPALLCTSLWLQTDPNRLTRFLAFPYWLITVHCASCALHAELLLQEQDGLCGGILCPIGQRRQVVPNLFMLAF